MTNCHKNLSHTISHLLTPPFCSPLSFLLHISIVAHGNVNEQRISELQKAFLSEKQCIRQDYRQSATSAMAPQPNTNSASASNSHLYYWRRNGITLL